MATTASSHAGASGTGRAGEPGLQLLPRRDPDRPIPWRTILAVLVVAVVAYEGFQLLRELTKVITWLVVAGFFAVVLGPAVDSLQRRLHLRRGLATGLVFLLGLGIIGGALYSFVRPVAESTTDFVDELPDRVEEARDGEGPLGDLVTRFNLDEQLDENNEDIQTALQRAASPAVDVVRSVFNTLFAFLTILVLAFLMLLRGPELCAGILSLINPRHRQRVSIVASDAGRAVSGYVSGLLLINVIAGIATYVFLRIAGVPNAEVLALFVAFATLLPLVGATLGAIPVVAFSFLHSTAAGIAALVFYIVYQQIENHVLQPTIMSRTVNVNPLTVLVSVLAGVELFGFLGALLAIPVAGVVQVVVRNLYDERLGKLKPEPTVGVDETPVSEVEGSQP